MPYLALSVQPLIITVRRSTQRRTRCTIATVANASPLRKILFALLLADFDLLLFATTTELIWLEGVLRLESCAAVLGNVSIGHLGSRSCFM